MVFVWPGVQENAVNMQSPVQSFSEHQGAVKVNIATYLLI